MLDLDLNQLCVTPLQTHMTVPEKIELELKFDNMIVRDEVGSYQKKHKTTMLLRKNILTAAELNSIGYQILLITCGAHHVGHISYRVSIVDVVLPNIEIATMFVRPVYNSAKLTTKVWELTKKLLFENYPTITHIRQSALTYDRETNDTLTTLGFIPESTSYVFYKQVSMENEIAPPVEQNAVSQEKCITKDKVKLPFSKIIVFRDVLQGLIDAGKVEQANDMWKYYQDNIDCDCPSDAICKSIDCCRTWKPRGLS